LSAHEEALWAAHNSAQQSPNGSAFEPTVGTAQQNPHWPTLAKTDWTTHGPAFSSAHRSTHRAAFRKANGTAFSAAEPAAKWAAK